MKGIPLRRRPFQQGRDFQFRRLRPRGYVGQVFRPCRPDQRFAGLIIVALGLAQPGQLAQHRIEPPRRIGGAVILRAKLIQPREVRQQQPRIEPPSHGDDLAVVEYLLFHPFQRAFGQHRLGMVARQHQRRAPARAKRRVAPPREIEPGTRDPHPRGSDPHIAVAREFIEEAELALRGQDGVEPTPSPSRLREGGQTCRAASEASRSAVGIKSPALPRQADVAFHRHPPAPETAALHFIHAPSPVSGRNRPCCRIRRCRKIGRARRNSGAPKSIPRGGHGRPEGSDGEGTIPDQSPCDPPSRRGRVQRSSSGFR